MSEMKKIKRVSIVAFCVASMSVLFHTGHTIYTIWAMMQQANEVSWNILVIISMFLLPSFLIVALIISLRLVHTIRMEVSPFNYKNVKNLKIIAIMLILKEPANYISQRMFIRNNPFPDAIDFIIIDGGFALTTGLIIYCIALVFQYGIALQTQVDETL